MKQFISFVLVIVLFMIITIIPAGADGPTETYEACTDGSSPYWHNPGSDDAETGKWKCASSSTQAGTPMISIEDRNRRDKVCATAIADIQNDPNNKRYWKSFIARYLSWAKVYGPVCPELNK